MKKLIVNAKFGFTEDREFKCEGKDYMNERRKHKKICKYYTQKPRSPVFNHHDSNCCCCVVSYHDSKCKGKRKATLKLGRKRRYRKASLTGRKS
eukprot:UN01697